VIFFEAKGMEYFEALQKRRACRSYKQEPIPKEMVDKLLYSAKRAPTASNVPYRHYILIDDERVIKSIKQISPSFSANSPLVLVIFTDLSIAKKRVGRVGEVSSLVDSGASGENVLLAATSLGLGSQFTMISAMMGIRKVLGLPDYCHVDLIIPLGYAEHFPSSHGSQKGANQVYHNQYGVLYE
jgi:nitroreductase